MTESVLVIGSGGREHALAWKLAQSPSIKSVYVAPGNAGTNSSGKISNCSVNVKNFDDIVQWCQNNNINLVIVGPEDPLANGLADHLKKNGIKCFGPCQSAAQIEASKEFAKQFMDRYQIPTARWRSFTNAQDAKDHILSAPYDALVVKASGLAAGKGVIVAANKEEAIQAVDTLKEDKGLSAASDVIVIEELLSGEEVSVLCFSDGHNIAVMPPAQDHKRLLDDDKGPNTGGMGAYCRCPLVSWKDLEVISSDVLQKTIDGMRQDGMPYIGVLYAGLMMTKNGPKVLEFNCRFGDPETQVILPLLKSDLYEIVLACVEGSLNNISIKWSKDKDAVGIVLVSGGYPGSYPKGKVITGLDKQSSDSLVVFHAGTSLQSGNVVTSGGRVLAVVAIADSLQEAAQVANKGCEEIDFEGKFYRSDIAKKALKKHSEGMTYKSAGVDIDSADNLVKKIKILTKETIRPEVCGGIGGFGGIFELSAFNDPYLVAKVGSIGEKLKFCQDCFKYEQAGYDLVATLANELLCSGAEPLFFLDTFTCGKLDTEVAAQVITGIAKACKDSNCTLIGGETAEMPGMYTDGQFDLIGFIRGAVEKPNLLPVKESIKHDDVAIALLSSSINTSKYGMIIDLMNKLDLSHKSIAPFDSNVTLEDALLRPSEIYVKSLLPVLKQKSIKAVAYAGKDGIGKSIEEVLPGDYHLVLDASKWRVPPVYNWIAANSSLCGENLIQEFNLGIDMLLVVDRSFANDVINHLISSGKKAALVGLIQKKTEGKSQQYKKVKMINLKFPLNPSVNKKHITILTSDKETCLQTLVETFNGQASINDAVISLIISGKQCTNLDIVKHHNIPTVILSSDSFKNSEDMDMKINEILKSSKIDLVCLDGFRKQFSSKFMEDWKGKVLNIHPSILPAFDCSNPCEEILSFGGRITGCTVHLVEEDGKFGEILKQEALTVDPFQTEKYLFNKMKQLQEYIYPKVISSFMLDKKSQLFNGFNHVENTKLRSDMQESVRRTVRPGFFKDSFHGLFDLKASGYKSPLLVSGTDGVGTKLKIAQTCNKHGTIGIDLVAMCVNDILTHGAEPLIFLQSFDCGKLEPETAKKVVQGIAEGCRLAKCALIGSEVNELPGIYLNHNQCIKDFNLYDVVGYAEGAVEKSNLLPRTKDIMEGDVVIGLASSGVHSNGYSLVRKIIEVKNHRYDDTFPLDPNMCLGEVLLTPTRIYVDSLLPLMKQHKIKAAAHITGGGLTENIPRVLPPHLRVVLEGRSWNLPPILRWLAKEGELSEKEMLKTFNCGIGMALIVDKKHENDVLKFLSSKDEIASTIGTVQHMHEGEEKVEVNNFGSHLRQTVNKAKSKKKVGVLISGSGTNLQALIDYTQNPSNCSRAEIVLVLSNVPDVEGLKRAERANIPTRVLSHKGYKKRVEFDMAVHSILKEAGVEMICLAGFMRILSKEFVELWQGKLLNVHPALLPSFKGVNAHKQALEAGVKITGCTVHFVEPEVDAGAIIEQAAVDIDVDDDEKSLQEKVKVLEHSIFPKALELVASGRVERDNCGKLKWKL